MRTSWRFFRPKDLTAGYRAESMRHERDAADQQGLAGMPFPPGVMTAPGSSGGPHDAGVRVRKPPSVKLSLEVTPEVNDVLRELVEQTHASGKSEVLRKAIALMKVAVDAKKEGKKIGIAEKDQPLATEIVGLGF